jgi:hypothetical protein
LLFWAFWYGRSERVLSRNAAIKSTTWSDIEKLGECEMQKIDWRGGRVRFLRASGNRITDGFGKGNQNCFSVSRLGEPVRSETKGVKMDLSGTGALKDVNSSSDLLYC